MLGGLLVTEIIWGICLYEQGKSLKEFKKSVEEYRKAKWLDR